MPVITVGPGEEFQTIEDAVAASSAGDTVEVDAGTYTNDFVSIGHSLTLQAVGGTVDLVATTAPPNEKGLIDVTGSGDVVISGFDISGVQISDDFGGNGAGIRYEGGTLTLDNVNIHNNQNGLLANPDAAGTITIRNSVFADNGSGTGFTHNIYVNEIALLTITDSTITGAVIGHEIKSRADNTVITNNRIENGTTGTASYEIDLPNGGHAAITGNVIQKGPNADNNPIAITSGEEGGVYANSSLTIENNAIINDFTSDSSTAVVNDTGTAAVFSGNVVYNWSTLVSGPADIGSNTVLTTEPPLDSFTPGDIVAPCYAAGTRILTVHGDRAVEDLAVGDIVVARHAGAAPITWIGQRSVDCRRHPRPWDVWPVRVRAGAFGDGVPHRDLLLSPDHAVFTDGVLIPIRYLANGRTIVQEPRDRVSYWHVELAAHDIVLAEGLPAETYLDTGNRGGFVNGGAAVCLHPDFAWGVWRSRACAELVVAGAELEAARSRLFECAERLGHARTGDPALHLVVDGVVLWPQIVADRHRFAVPAVARRVRLVSRRAVPAELQVAAADHRCLGVAVARIALDGCEIELTGSGLGDGWHARTPDETAWRWTDGDAGLDIGGAGGTLDIALAIAACYWLEPAGEGLGMLPPAPLKRLSR